MKSLLNSIESFLEAFFLRIEKNTLINSEHFPFIRIFSSFFTLIYILPSFKWIGELPNTYFKPDFFNFTNLFDGFLPFWYFQLTDILIIILLILVLLGIFTRYSLWFLSLILIFNYGFQFSLGKIDHILLFPIFFLVLSITNSGRKFSITKDKVMDTEGLATSLMAIFIVFAYFTAGFEKSFFWIDFNLETSGFLSWLYSGYFLINRNELLAEFFFNLPPLFYEFLDYSAIIMELSGVFFLLYSRTSWFLYLLIITGFHLMNTLVLNIPFDPHIIIISAWLHFPLMKNKPIYYIAYLIPLIFFDLKRQALLWLITLFIGLYNFFLSNYSNSKNS